MSDFWNAAKGVLSTVAPMLATAVGGPLAGAATSAIIGALGLAPDSTPEAVADAVAKASPDQLLAIKQAEDSFAATMAKLNIDAAKLGNDDRANARSRETTLKDWTPRVLAVVVSIGFFGLLGLMAFYVLPEGNAAILNIMLGSLGSGWTMILSYYFGSSAGSSEKTQLLANREAGPSRSPLGDPS